MGSELSRSASPPPLTETAVRSGDQRQWVPETDAAAIVSCRAIWLWCIWSSTQCSVILGCHVQCVQRSTVWVCVLYVVELPLKEVVKHRHQAEGRGCVRFNYLSVLLLMVQLFSTDLRKLLRKIQILWQKATFFLIFITQVVTFPGNGLLLWQSHSVTNSVTFWNKYWVTS